MSATIPAKKVYVVVTGGRDYLNRERVNAELARLEPTIVFHGDCPTGADRHARNWADEQGIPGVAVPAPWKGRGKAAGPIRNGWLLTIATSLAAAREAELTGLAFPGGVGTADMTRRMESAGVRVIKVS